MDSSIIIIVVSIEGTIMLAMLILDLFLLIRAFTKRTSLNMIISRLVLDKKFVTYFYLIMLTPVFTTVGFAIAFVLNNPIPDITVILLIMLTFTVISYALYSKSKVYHF
jgi:hypothetical protein